MNTPPERRICSCGRPAEHASICNLGDMLVGDDERVPLELEELYARRREERFAKRKPTLNAERKIRRADLSTIELHHHALERAVTLSTVGAGNVAASSAGAAHPSKNLAIDRRGAQTLDDDPRWRERWTVIRRALERVHELLDEAEGHGSRASVDMDTEDKNKRILLEGRGYSCEAVVDLLGRDIAGSPKTVSRVRRRTHDVETFEGRIARAYLGGPVRMVDGEPVESASEILSKPGLRRVRIDHAAN